MVALFTTPSRETSSIDGRILSRTELLKQQKSFIMQSLHRTVLALLLAVSLVHKGTSFSFEPSVRTLSACTTPNRLPGECVSLLKCPPLLRLLRRPVPSSVVVLLRQSVCKFTERIPHVCCPLPVNPALLTTISTSTTTESTTTTTKSTTEATTTTTEATTIISTTEVETTTYEDDTTTLMDTTASTRPEGTTSVTETTTQKQMETTKPEGSTTVSTTTTTEEAETTTMETITTTAKVSEPLSEAPRGIVQFSNFSECGQSSDVDKRKIVGGYPSKLHAWPWIAAIGYMPAGATETQFYCGGTLISRRHVLTAAHCVVRDDLTIVRLSEHIIGDDTDGANHVDIRVRRRIVHGKYNSRSYANDIALLELEQDVPMRHAEIVPACLPQLDSRVKKGDFVGWTPYVAGWGATEYRGETSNKLLEAQLTVMSLDDCTAKFKPFGNVKITKRKICAYDPLEVKDSCQGDSGGPLMLLMNGDRYEDARWYLIGIVSFGYKCATPGFPGVYTKVAKYTSWIEQNLNQPFDNAIDMDEFNDESQARSFFE